MISKEKFIESIEKLKAYMEWEHKVYELGVSFWDREEVSNFVDNYITLLAESLEMKDTEDLYFYIYETNFGVALSSFYEQDEVAKEIFLSGYDILYNYLAFGKKEIDFYKNL